MWLQGKKWRNDLAGYNLKIKVGVTIVEIK